MTLVSIITPAFRAESTIARAARSIITQTYENWEMLIISDDGQNYKTFLQAQHINDTRIRYLTTGAMGGGVSSARNIALDAAHGDIIAMLDADDIAYTTRLARMVPLAAQHGMCACAFEYVRYDQSRKQQLSTIGTHRAESLLTPADYLRVYYSSNAMLVFDRTKVPVRWREDLQAMEDVCFALEAYDHIPAIYHLPEVLHEYVYTQNSLSNGLIASQRLIDAKKYLLNKLEDNTLGITHAAQVFADFLIVSLETEYEYQKALQRGQQVSFTTFLEQNLGVR